MLSDAVRSVRRSAHLLRTNDSPLDSLDLATPPLNRLLVESVQHPSATSRIFHSHVGKSSIFVPLSRNETESFLFPLSPSPAPQIPSIQILQGSFPLFNSIFILPAETLNQILNDIHRSNMGEHPDADPGWDPGRNPAGS